MDPISGVLMIASLTGGIMSAVGGKQVIDPELLKRLFGAGAVTEEMQALFNHVINSSQGQQMMANAAEQGQQFQRNMASRSAAAGFGPEGTSGASIFSGAATEGAVNSLQRGVKSDVMSQVLPLAQQMVSARMNAYMNSYNNTPTTMEKVGSAIGNAAGMGLMAQSMQTPTKLSPDTAKTVATAGLSPMTSAPQGKLGTQYAISGQVPAQQPQLFAENSRWARARRGLGSVFGRW